MGKNLVTAVLSAFLAGSALSSSYAADKIANMPGFEGYSMTSKASYPATPQMLATKWKKITSNGLDGKDFINAYFLDCDKKEEITGKHPFAMYLSREGKLYLGKNTPGKIDEDGIILQKDLRGRTPEDDFPGCKNPISNL